MSYVRFGHDKTCWTCKRGPNGNPSDKNFDSGCGVNPLCFTCHHPPDKYPVVDWRNWEPLKPIVMGARSND